MLTNASSALILGIGSCCCNVLDMYIAKLCCIGKPSSVFLDVVIAVAYNNCSRQVVDNMLLDASAT